MQYMTLENIATVCGGTLTCDCDKKKEVAGVVLDSRQVEKDYLFIATKGERVDGHRFIPQVFEKGAAAVICEVLPENPTGPCILVPDSFQALKDIAEFYREKLGIKVVGITGSVGKTSTKEFVASVLAQGYSVHKTAGNFNNEVGLPLTVLGIRKEHQIAVLEMGINHFGEMHRLSKIAKPDVCVMTNIGQCHLEFLGSRDGILKAKSEIFDYMAEDGNVVVNGDDDKLATIEQVHGKNPITFGRSAANHIYATDIISNGLFGSSAQIHIGEEGTFMAQIPLPGEHMVYNALCATAVGKLFGLSLEQIQKGLARVQPTTGRSHIIKAAHYTIIDDCYNANPVSMEAAIDLLINAKGRKVAILGDMFELGETSETMHKRVGCYAADKAVDVLICIGESSKAMYEGAVEKFMKRVYYFDTKEAFLTQMHLILEEQDTILIKASHSMGFEEIVKTLQEHNKR